MLSPLSNDAGIKALLPFALALKGEIDIEQVKITTPVQQIEDVEIQFSIRRPAVKNYLGATYCSLSPEKRKLMTCLLYTSPSPRDRQKSRMPSSA